MPKTRFQRGAFQEIPATRVVRRIVTPLLVIAAILFLISGFRAIVQVYKLDLWVSTQTPSLQSGFEGGMSVITSGRARATVKIELIQEGRSETLVVDSVRGRNFAVFNPIPRRSTRQIVVSPVILSRFNAGAATVRATAVGSPQWTRTPPPTVRTVQINITP